jgi:hypothetical protein
MVMATLAASVGQAFTENLAKMSAFRIFCGLNSTI